MSKSEPALQFNSDQEEMAFWIKPENSDQVEHGLDPITEARKLFQTGAVDFVYLGDKGYYDCTTYKLKPQHAAQLERVRTLARSLFKVLE